VGRPLFSRTFRSFVTGVFLIAPLLKGRQEKAAQPEAKAQALVQRMCVSCHELDTVTAERRTQIGWQQNVEDMVSRGAQGSDQEMAELVAYLTKYYGKINVNTATVEQLRAFLELTEKEAQAIASYRDRNGKFKNIDQLKAVPNVNAGKLQEKRDLIAFSL
jgi:competence ComEA-like helix-hairpin-helix protein